MQGLLVISSFLLAGCFSSANRNSAQSTTISTDISPQLRTIVTAGLSRDHGQNIEAAYQSRDFGPLWVQAGRPSPSALAMIAALENSRQTGLKPEDYEAALWAARVEALKAASSDGEKLARFDAALTNDALRYVSDLRTGRANPTPIPFIVTDGTTEYDLAHFVAQKLAPSSDVPTLLNSIEPGYMAYRRTEDALQMYLALEAKGPETLLPSPQENISAGDAYAAADLLARRLQTLRDLPPTLALPANNGIYTAAIAEGVKHFQARHGLTSNGKLDSRTLAALNTPISQRIVQLQDALERWRWLPSDFPQLPVAVNIPEFVLRAFNDDHKIVLRSNVVVGKAFGHQTPVFAKEIKYITFRPYWNVPLSITRGEIIPHIQRSSSYLAKENLELTDQSGHVVTTSAVSSGMIAQLRSGRLMVRQRPGPKNSLGLIKFIFPNSDNVYLHSTPAQQLFSQARRDFSHGCIRVEKPAELAAWLLRDQPQWTLDAIKQAMQSGPDNKQVNLTKPVPVVIVYMTAVVEEDGEIYFFDDIYGLDAKLNATLAKGPPYR